MMDTDRGVMVLGCVKHDILQIDVYIAADKVSPGEHQYTTLYSFYGSEVVC